MLFIKPTDSTAFFFIDPGFNWHFFAEYHERLDRGEFQALCNIDVLAFRITLTAYADKPLLVVGFEGHCGIFLDKIRVGDLNHMKVPVFAVFIFDKSKPLSLNRCDCSVHRHYRLINRLSTQFAARSVKHNARADYVFGLSVSDKVGGCQ